MSSGETFVRFACSFFELACHARNCAQYGVYTRGILQHPYIISAVQIYYYAPFMYTWSFKAFQVLQLIEANIFN